MSFCNTLCAYYPDTLELSSFSSVQEVGIGLFLGLAILQIITSGGVSSLYRKVDRLNDAVKANQLNGLRADFRRIKNQMVTLEQRLQSFGFTLFSVVFALVAIAVGTLAATTLISTREATCWMGLLLLGYNLLLPVLMFAGVTLYVRKLSSGVRNEIETFERSVIKQLTGTN